MKKLAGILKKVLLAVVLLAMFYVFETTIKNKHFSGNKTLTSHEVKIMFQIMNFLLIGASVFTLSKIFASKKAELLLSYMAGVFAVFAIIAFITLIATK